MKKIYRLLDEIIALNVQVDYSRHDTMLTVSQSEEKREQLQIELSRPRTNSIKFFGSCIETRSPGELSSMLSRKQSRNQKCRR